MLSLWKDIAVFLDASPAGERTGRYAAALARRHKAHLVGVHGVSRDVGRHPSEDFVRGQEAISDALEHRRLEAERQVLIAGRRVADLSAEYGVGAEFRVVWRENLGDDGALRALHSDLIVAAHPSLPGLPGGWTAEHLLLVTGIPVLLVPEAWAGPEIGDHVLIAWNGSREARRAVNDALPFLRTAGKATVLTVDADRRPHAPGEDPSADLRRHLAEHGITVETHDVPSKGRPVADVILEEVGTQGADLLVIGAYSHPRTAEILFGGVTRDLLDRTPIPMLIAR